MRASPKIPTEPTKYRKHQESKLLPGVLLARTRGKYRSRIYFQGRMYNLGTYDNEIDAHMAYLKAKLRPDKTIPPEEIKPYAPTIIRIKKNDLFGTPWLGLLV